MLEMNTLKQTAPAFRTSFIFMLLSVIFFCVSKTDAAIVDGDFETDLIAGSNPATSPIPSWAPTNSPDGNTRALGVDPGFYNSVFSSVASDGTPAGSVSAVFVTSPVGKQISMASISQDVATTSGKFYDIRLWVANLPTGDSNQPDTSARENLFSVMWNGAPVDLTHVSIVGHGVFAAPNPLLNPTELDPAGAGVSGTYVLAATGAWTLVIIPNQAAAGSGATQTNLTISAQNNNNATAVDSVAVTETPEPSSIVLLAAGAALAGLRRRRAQRAA